MSNISSTDSNTKTVQKLTAEATQNVADILELSIKHDSTLNQALVIYDTDNPLTDILTQAYRKALPEAKFIDFATLTKAEIIQIFSEYSEGDLVVMIQTGSFRLDDFRIRIHLFQLKLKVIEHLHLYRNSPGTWQSYVEAIAYDKDWYHNMGYWLKTNLTECQNLIIRTSDGVSTSEISLTKGLEIPKLNTGDYSELKNVGGTFPIGEVFTEAKYLEDLNGKFWVYAFANSKFEIITPEPFEVNLQQGMVTGWSTNASPEFAEVINKIKEIERPIVREIGFGLNRGIQKENPLGDITAFERVIGVHFSLGEKHSTYKKPGISAHKARFHVDLFLATKEVIVNGNTIFKDGEYLAKAAN